MTRRCATAATSPLWIRQDAIDAWTPRQTGKRGAQPVYSDGAIETALTFRLLFHLALRQTKGFLGGSVRFVQQRLNPLKF
jgi:Transposase DDE domain